MKQGRDLAIGQGPLQPVLFITSHQHIKNCIWYIKFDSSISEKITELDREKLSNQHLGDQQYIPTQSLQSASKNDEQTST
jgi:hypothetical protein